MLKDYLKKQHISMYSLAKKSGVAYSTLNDLANGRVDADSCRVGLLRALAGALDITMDELYEITKVRLAAYSDEYRTAIDITVKNKTYYANFEYEGEKACLMVCEANSDTAEFLDDLVNWSIMDYVDEREWDELNEILADAKK